MRKNILLVEDDEEILMLVSLALGRAGFSVKKASHYREALTEIDKNPDLDVALVDYYLPEVDGITLSNMILEKGCHFPVILFTAADFPNYENTFPPNIVDIIKKPFNIDDVTEKLDKTIKMKQYLCCVAEKNKKGQVREDGITHLIYSEKAESLKGFLSELSHRIKNALQTISTNIQLLEKGYIDESDREHCFNTIKKKINVIKDELDILKHPEEFRTVMQFSLKTVIKDVLKELKEIIKVKDIYVKTEFMKKLPLYTGKKGLFYVLVKDLLSFLINCASQHGILEISLSSHQQNYFLEIYQSGVVQGCDDVFKFYDINIKNNGAGLTRVMLNLKELKGKIDLSLPEGGGINVKISFPMH